MSWSLSESAPSSANRQSAVGLSEPYTRYSACKTALYLMH